MTLEERWNFILQHNPHPCFLADPNTYKVFYANDAFIKLVGPAEAVIGKRYYELIPNDNAKSFQDIKLDWENNEVIYRNVVNQSMELEFRVTAIMTPDQQFMYAMLQPLDHDGAIGNSLFETAMTRCMDIFQEPEEQVMHSFMELLCDFYQCERAYVYRFRRDTGTINCISQWSTDPQFHVTQEVGTKMNANALMDWVQQQNDSGMDLATGQQKDFDPESTMGKLFSTFQMQNITLATVEDAHHQVVGVVGLSNREQYQESFDKRLIHAVARFVAQEVTKVTMDKTLFQLHHRDVLTGLYNRTGYSKYLGKIMETLPESVGVVSINVNGLKKINQNLGHAAGDKHIQEAAQRFKKHFGYVFFRVSGDEFIGIEPIVSKETFEAKVMELHSTMRSEENSAFSMGHAWREGNYQFSDLLEEAETVMYINKQEYYFASNHQFDLTTDNILGDLLTYLQNDAFIIYLQPQVRLEDGSLYGAEALVRRYDSESEEMILPDQFVPLYEKKSIIRHVDIFVMESVCKILKKWLKEGRNIPISVNLSRVTLLEYGIVDTVVRICDEYAVPHELLIIEVTERVGLIENNVASDLIASFKENGFRISLDDFGCAYSNIITLAQIEVDEVKVDKSLVDDLITNKKNHILVKNVLSMCNELENTSTLAEGIEDQDQAKMLHSLGCDLGQGYTYSRPLPVEEFEKKYFI